MLIRRAQFIASNTDLSQCPKGIYPEYAFIGRSNVGKSSLINALMKRKQLAKTSKKPGKTQCINHYLIDSQWYLVDLPGYGYARLGTKKQNMLEKMTKIYLYHRKNLFYIFLLIDIRHKIQSNDFHYVRWMGKCKLPFVIIFSKSDKVNKLHIENSLAIYKEMLSKEWAISPPYFITSVLKKTGMREIIHFIRKTNEDYGDHIKTFIL